MLHIFKLIALLELSSIYLFRVAAEIKKLFRAIGLSHSPDFKVVLIMKTEKQKP